MVPGTLPANQMHLVCVQFSWYLLGHHLWIWECWYPYQELRDIIGNEYCPAARMIPSHLSPPITIKVSSPVTIGFMTWKTKLTHKRCWDMRCCKLSKWERTYVNCEISKNRLHYLHIMPCSTSAYSCWKQQGSSRNFVVELNWRHHSCFLCFAQGWLCRCLLWQHDYQACTHLPNHPLQ